MQEKDFITYAQELIEEESRERYNEKLRSNCSTSRATYYIPETGERKHVIYRCKDFRNCGNCLKCRMQEIRARLEVVLIEHGYFHIVALSDDDYPKFLRKIGADNLIRFPVMVKQQRILNCVISTDLLTCDRVSKTIEKIESIEQGFLKSLALTPHNKRISGNLGKIGTDEAPEKKIEDPIEVQFKEFIIEADKDSLNGFIKEANKSLPPMTVTGDTIQYAITLQQKALTDILDSKGINYTTLCYAEREIDINRINWSWLQVNSICDQDIETNQRNDENLSLEERKKPLNVPENRFINFL